MGTLKEDMIEELKKLPVCIPQKGDTQWVVRCPYCGDSKNPMHGHLSIHIDKDLDDWMCWRCLKCGEGAGYLSEEFLIDIGCSPSQELLDRLRAFNKKAFKAGDYTSKEARCKIPQITPGHIEKSISIPAKAEYISDRIGIPKDEVMYQAHHLKIILDLLWFLYENGVKIIDGYSQKRLYFMNYNYVGFLSANNNSITLRAIHDEPKLRRYDKIIINPKNINRNTFYHIPFTLDLMNTEGYQVRIAEGTFDILSVYYNIMHKEEKKNLYFACCGYGYGTILRYLIYNGIFIGVAIHIYCDNDKTDDDLRRYFSKYDYLLVWFDKVVIHRNIYTHEDGSHEKDFGVKEIHDYEYEWEG